MHLQQQFNELVHWQFGSYSTCQSCHRNAQLQSLQYFPLSSGCLWSANSAAIMHFSLTDNRIENCVLCPFTRHFLQTFFILDPSFGLLWWWSVPRLALTAEMKSFSLSVSAFLSDSLSLPLYTSILSSLSLCISLSFCYSDLLVCCRNISV